MKKNLTPGIKSDFRKKVPLLTANGAPTGKVLAVPYSIGYGEEFKLGGVRLQNTQRGVKALDPIPASWFVNLSEGVQDLSDVS